MSVCTCNVQPIGPASCRPGPRTKAEADGDASHLPSHMPRASGPPCRMPHLASTPAHLFHGTTKARQSTTKRIERAPHPRAGWCSPSPYRRLHMSMCAIHWPHHLTVVVIVCPVEAGRGGRTRDPHAASPSAALHGPGHGVA